MNTPLTRHAPSDLSLGFGKDERLTRDGAVAPAVGDLADKLMREVPKQLKRVVREWAGIAHDRDLRKALSELRVHLAGLIECYEHDLSAS